MSGPIHIIADTAGHFDSFLKLVEKLPPGRIILLGDLIDRGPKSKEMIQYCIDNNIVSLFGNHEHIFLDYYRGLFKKDYNKHYQEGVWIAMPGQKFDNGGFATVKSYMKESQFDGMPFHPSMIKEIIPQSHIDYIENMPFYLIIDDLILSHAPVNGRSVDKAALDKLTYLGIPTKNGISVSDESRRDISLIWNRGIPHKIKNKIQIFGHQGAENVKFYTDKNPKGTYIPQTDFWAVCLDASRGSKLTALSYPSMTITQQDYID